MIDNRLHVLFYNVTHKGGSLETVATVLKEPVYKDVLIWYEKYVGQRAVGDRYCGCAELLYYLYQHDNWDLLSMEHFVKIQSVLCEKYGVSNCDVFSFFQDYRELLYS